MLWPLLQVLQLQKLSFGAFFGGLQSVHGQEHARVSARVAFCLKTHMGHGQRHGRVPGRVQHCPTF